MTILELIQNIAPIIAKVLIIWIIAKSIIAIADIGFGERK